MITERLAIESLINKYKRIIFNPRLDMCKNQDYIQELVQFG